MEDKLFNSSYTTKAYEIIKNEKKPTISISQCLAYIQEPFDAEGVINKNYDKWQSDPESQYYGKTKEEIKGMWEEKGAVSCRYGSLLDDYIGINLTKSEDDLLLWKLDNNFEEDERLMEHCKAFDDFYDITKKSGDTVFIDREKTVFFDMGDYFVKGRFDALFYNKRTNTFIIIDWKSSGTIETSGNKWTKKLLGPCSKLPALNYYTYTLQLYFYKKTLVQMGYLPEGTTLDDVKVMIVNLPDHIIPESGQHFATHNPAFEYDDELMEKLFKFAYLKHQIINKK